MYRRGRSKRRILFEQVESRTLLSVSTIWSASVTAPEFQPDFVDAELGVKFQASVDGFVEGVRFLKGPDNIGVHTGHLWDASTGQLLGTVTFTNETASGWQEADFANPVPIHANHTYVVSYFAPLGRYSYTYNYFTGASATSSDGLLTALASGTAGPNGVYIYYPNSAFPTQSFDDLNYWVDVVFSQTPDHAPTGISLANNTVLEQQPTGTLVGAFGTTDPDIGDTFTYTLEDGPGGTGNSAFQIVNNQLETTGPLSFATQNNYSIRVRSTDANGLSTVQIFTINVVQVNQVVGRYLFYAGSSFDGPGNSDNAIATDKSALLPGQTATFNNYSSYDRGINGIMIDVVASVNTLIPADFSFLVGNDNDPSAWTAVSVNPTITIRPGAGVGGTTRIQLTWPDHTIQNEWLQVTMLADADTLLTSNYTFYFGNAVGESGNSPDDAKVTAIDQIGARADAGAAGITNAFDFNRDGTVDTTDEAIAGANYTNVLNALQLITVPADPPSMSLKPAVGPGPVSPTAALPSNGLTGQASESETGLLITLPVMLTGSAASAGAEIRKLPAIHQKPSLALSPTRQLSFSHSEVLIPNKPAKRRPAGPRLQSGLDATL